MRYFTAFILAVSLIPQIQNSSYLLDHNNETYSIIMISNLSTDIHKLDLGLQIIRKLMVCSVKTNYNIIIKDINENLLELDKIIQKNYMLRDSYINMEKDIQKSLSVHYNILRDYQYDIEMKINDIISKIKSTMKHSIDLGKKDESEILLEKYTSKEYKQQKSKELAEKRKKDKIIN